MSIKSLVVSVLSLVVVGCNAPTNTDKAVVAIPQPANPIIGVNQDGAPFTLGLLEVCPAIGDPYGQAAFYGTITVDCGSHQEVITLY